MSSESDAERELHELLVKTVAETTEEFYRTHKSTLTTEALREAWRETAAGLISHAPYAVINQYGVLTSDRMPPRWDD